MTPPVGNWMIGYGAFLIAVGIAGYLSNPEEARRIADPAYRQKLAEAVARALE